MLMLSLSSSGPVASAALIEDKQPLAILRGPLGRTHSETIMPLCRKLLENHRLTPGSIDLFAADAGPGSFTGMRRGVCAANPMAAAAGKPAVCASSLSGLLHGRENSCALLDCRNGNGYAMARAKGLRLPEAPVVISELLARLPEDITIIGDTELHSELIRSILPHARLESAHVDAVMTGLAAWPEGEIPSGPVSPLYLRPSQAERMAKERAK